MPDGDSALYVSCPRCGQTDALPPERADWEAMCGRCLHRFALAGSVVRAKRPGRLSAACAVARRQLTRHPAQVCASALRAVARTVTGDRRPSGFLVRRRSTGGPPPAEWTFGTVIISDFVVERKLGQGGMGVVHLVRDWASGSLYAVKRMLALEPEGRRQFHRELVVWRDMPEHPLLAPFRFIRWVGEEVLIFTDFVDGGTLADAVVDGRVTRLPDLLDLAIQFAWGLHVAHEAGFIHCDVKPHNALLTAAGRLKVTDFGLARSRSVAGVEGDAGPENVVVSSGGMTRAYASPEQLGRKDLSRQTDIWSWAVSVLDMFVGRVPSCRSGSIAPRVLKEHHAAGQTDGRLPRMPQPLVELLRRCFRENPADRPATLGAIAEELVAIYRQTSGRPYPNELVMTRRPTRDPGAAPSGGSARTWSDPRPWLVKALRAAGRDPREAETLSPRAQSRDGQTLADLAVLDAALLIYRRLAAAGEGHLLPAVAHLETEKGVVLGAVNDLPAQLDAFEAAAEIYRRLAADRRAPGLYSRLARVRALQGQTLLAMGDASGAVRAFAQAVGLCRRVGLADKRPGLTHTLAVAQKGAGSALLMLGDAAGAARAYSESAETYWRVLGSDARSEVAAELVHLLVSKARACDLLADPGGGAGATREALRVFRRAVKDGSRADHVAYDQDLSVLVVHYDGEVEKIRRWTLIRNGCLVACALAIPLVTYMGYTQPSRRPPGPELKVKPIALDDLLQRQAQENDAAWKKRSQDVGDLLEGARREGGAAPDQDGPVQVPTGGTTPHRGDGER